MSNVGAAGRRGVVIDGEDKAEYTPIVEQLRKEVDQAIDEWEALSYQVQDKLLTRYPQLSKKWAVLGRLLAFMMPTWAPRWWWKAMLVIVNSFADPKFAPLFKVLFDWLDAPLGVRPRPEDYDISAP